MDGGYVLCSLAGAADGGPNGDGGLAVWMCHPGTYFCDLGGEIGNCLQCRSDEDCSNQGLPTYDPLRSRCDLDSGVPGYQDFCQECLDDTDCLGKDAGAFCDLSPTFPPNALEAPIEALGYETCGQIQTDCRLAGGPLCLTLDQICDPFNGRCVDPPTRCSTDTDCVGFLAVTLPSTQSGSPYLVRPYCVNGACNDCDGGVCPNNNACASDSDCGNPNNSPTGLRCEPFDGGLECVCTRSSQCSGAWPACVGLDAGHSDDAGQPVGICSCDSDVQCGDGGLVCLPPERVDAFWGFALSIFGPQAGSPFCGIPCTSPGFPSCAALAGEDICDPLTRVCDWCLTDEQCVSSLGAGGPTCDGPLIIWPPPPGNCGCILDADCRAGERCLSEGSRSLILGICKAVSSRCTPESCGGSFCNWDSGACVAVSNEETLPSCVNNADCSDEVCWEGSCVRCRDASRCPQPVRTVYDQPCLDSTECDGGLGCSDNLCQPCTQPSDCAAGTLCLSNGICSTVCAADACPPRQVCDTFDWAGYGPNLCYQCLSAADCPDGEGCNGDSHTCGTCRGPTAYGGPYECPPDSVCSDYWLGSSGVCLSNCDRESCPADHPICGVLPSLTPDHRYCFGCLQDSDCGDAGAWCDQSFSRSFTCQPAGS